MLLHFDLAQTPLIALIFIWTGFVRSGLGFGGAALGLPLMLFVDDQPLLWLPIIGSHLLFLSGLTLSSRLDNIDWRFLGRSSYYIIPAALVGVFGLLNLPIRWLLFIIYGVTLFYAVIWAPRWTTATGPMHCWNGDHTRENAYSRLRYVQMFAPKMVERIEKTAPPG